MRGFRRAVMKTLAGRKRNKRKRRKKKKRELAKVMGEEDRRRK